MDRAALKRRVSVGMDALVKKHLNLIFKNNAAPQIQEAILAEYDEELVDVVTDRSSRTNPNFYRAEFQERLEEFEYVEDAGDTVTLNVPDMQNFDFSGRLKVIETIMHGLMGNYVEVDEEQYKQIFNKKPINQDPIDEYVPPKERIYLVKYTPKIKQAEKDLQTKFPNYPFSNTPPIDIMDAGDVFAKANMDRWIREALEAAQKEFVNTYKGVR
jgi:hypothetical protein